MGVKVRKIRKISRSSAGRFPVRFYLAAAVQGGRIGWFYLAAAVQGGRIGWFYLAAAVQGGSIGWFYLAAAVRQHFSGVRKSCRSITSVYSAYCETTPLYR